MLQDKKNYVEDPDFLEKRMKVSKMTKDPLLQIEMFENETAKQRLMQLVSVAQETFLYTRDTVEIHTSDLNLMFRAMLHLVRLSKDDLSDLEYCYVLSNLDHVTTKLIQCCEEIKTYSDSPMVRKKKR
ncbi:hypothetical protein WQ54_01170 [Bacillus sp. SA1-12]|uniref:hypothetical protein n=1 Tax=Bacillus sp. SA1-12 TaxID=1455638 RepID=UPI0006263D47|nr:hypothetical protein [Bacillus sp. SA1-12]KKI94177.1 hypothetical protein WQ54_01170 [Bacillus sp. SA1-12]